MKPLKPEENIIREENKNDVATNTGAIEETINKSLHNKKTQSSINVNGSDRADLYEAALQGKIDADEETDALKNTEQKD